MSLISSANFMAPLRSKVQIAGMLIIVFLVLILRYAGIGTSDPSESPDSGTQSYSRGSAAKVRDLNSDIDSYLGAVRNRREAARGGSGDAAVDGLFDRGNNGNSAGDEDRDGKDSSQQPEKLNDIKRSLGL